MEQVRATFVRQVDRLRRWAASVPAEHRTGEWECEYPEWTELYTSWGDFLSAAPPSTWTTAESDAVLYALARDNEAEHLADGLSAQNAHELTTVAETVTRCGEQDARWQLAVVLGRAGKGSADLESALLRLTQDSDEYVRRRALESLAKIGSSHVEEVALSAWNEGGPNMLWSKMMALWALREVHSPTLGSLLRDATQSTDTLLRDFAAKLNLNPPGAHGGDPSR
jgi:hypothetical protein